MHFNSETIVSICTALGIGGILQALVNYLKDRKKDNATIEKSDVDTKLAYLNTVIVRLDEEVKRINVDRDRVQTELDKEREDSANLRKRVRELEDEIDGVRRSARDTQNKCDDLAERLKQLVSDAQER